MLSEKDGLISLSNRIAECKISLWGANLVSYRPKTEKHDVFWLGERNKFDKIQAIRGGVPVCWPRFAEERLNSHLPRHGFARLSEWTLKNVEVDEKKIEVVLSLIPAAEFNLKISANMRIIITDKLEYCLETTNHGEEVFDFSEALHAYFNVSSLDNVELKGLAVHRYKSSLDGKTYDLNENLKISGEFDAAFINHHAPVEIVDRALNRIISVEKTGSETTVVWNPDKDLAEMSEGQYKKFVCVEPANQGEAFVRLLPRQKHKISMNVSVRKLFY